MTTPSPADDQLVTLTVRITGQTAIGDVFALLHDIGPDLHKIPGVINVQTATRDIAGRAGRAASCPAPSCPARPKQAS